MSISKIIGILGIYLAATFVGYAQPTSVELASAAGTKITAADLSEQAKRLYETRREVVSNNRKKLLEQNIAEILLNAEGSSRGISGEKVLAEEFAKLPKPTDAEIRAVYDGNRSAIGDRSFESVRTQIIGFLMDEPEKKAENELLTRLRARFRFSPGSDVNGGLLKPTETLFTIDGKPFTLNDFETRNRIALNDVDVHIYEDILAAIEDALLEKLIEKEAQAKGTDAGAVIASEITDKMREFSDAERASLWNSLQTRLFAKYNAKVLLPKPEPLVLNVSADDDPSLGPAQAPVTIVMFNDFQCSTCASFGPIVKSVAEKFGGKVRLVIRDFPLESIHENAFNAALAANAAALQGKYFEYGSLLYANQASLDEATLLRLAGELKLDIARFKADMADTKNAAEIRKDIADGKSYGVGGTPTIYINGVKHHGLSEPKLRSAIEKALNRVK